MAPRRAPLPRALLLAAGGVLVGANCSDDAAACAAEATDSLMLLQRGSESHLVSADWGPRKRKDRTPVVVDWPGADAQVPMKDVVKSFMMMSPAGSAFSLTTGRQFPAGYSRGYPPYSEHFQGVQRYGKYIYVSGSGETASQAQIIVCEVESRSDVGPMARGSDSGPKSGDRVVKTVSFDREFWHAGGFSIFGSTLVVGTEAGCSTTDRMLGRCEKASRIFFFDLADPANPSQLPYILERKGGTAGAVALTQEADGRFLLMVGGVDSASLDFYRSSSGASLASDPGFKKFATWDSSALLVSAGASSAYNSYQNLNFVRQENGDIFLIGTTRTMSGLGDDVADLFLLDNSQEDSVTIKKVAGLSLQCPSFTCNFAAGGGAYVDSDGSLLIYGTDWEPSSGKIYITEFKGYR